MLDLTILDILHITLIIFVTIIGTLLVIILLKVNKILTPFLEMLSYYERFRSYMSVYSQIPHLLKEKVFSYVNNLFSKNKKN